MLESSLLPYKKFLKDIESMIFKVNPYLLQTGFFGKQHAITWYVDDLKSSQHLDSKVNDKFLEWLKEKYASDELCEVKAVRGYWHSYLAMILHFSRSGVLRVDMMNYQYTIHSWSSIKEAWQQQEG